MAAGGGAGALPPGATAGLAGSQALGPMAALAQTQMTQLLDQIQKGVREMHLTVSWKEGKRTESIDLVTDVVSLRQGSDRNGTPGARRSRRPPPASPALPGVSWQHRSFPGRTPGRSRGEHRQPEHLQRPNPRQHPPGTPLDPFGRPIRMKPARGFTLLEVVIAVAVTAMMGGLIAAAFQSGYRTKELVEDEADHYRTLRTATDRMVREISAAFVSDHYDLRRYRDQNDRPTNFIGTRDRLLFSCMAHQRLYADAKESDQMVVEYFTKSTTAPGRARPQRI